MVLGWVSIHALVKSATVWCDFYGVGVVVSIHALVKSATVPVHLTSPRVFCFNPRAREERDLVQEICARMTEVSIHALVKSATVLTIYTDAHVRVSIHALVKSATESGSPIRTELVLFQSTRS